MPTILPFRSFLIITLIAIMLPASAMAQDDSATSPAWQKKSLGLSLNSDTILQPTLLGGGLLGSPISYQPAHSLDFGLPINEAWRLETGISGRINRSEASRSSSVNLSVTPQRALVQSNIGQVYAGAAISGSLSRFKLLENEELGTMETSSSSSLFSLKPLLGVRGLITPSFGVGFETGPQITYSPEQTTDNGAGGENVQLSSTQVTISSHITITYFF